MKDVIKAKLPIIIPIACGVLCVALIAIAVAFAWPSLFSDEKDATEPATTESSSIADNVSDSEPTNGDEPTEPSSGDKPTEPSVPSDPYDPGFVTDENGNDNYANDIF